MSTPDLVAANNRFSFALLAQVIAEKADANVIISPPSVLLALALLVGGAAGTTRAAITRTLNLPDVAPEALDQAAQELRASLAAADPQIELLIANTLWGNQEIDFAPDYLERCRSFYAAEIASADFSQPETSAAINRWVAGQTHEKITSIVDRLDPETLLVLINAIYLKGIWRSPFDPDATRERRFTLASGQSQFVPMMSQSGSFDYLSDGQVQVIRLPYGQGRMCMEIFLPVADLDTFLGTLDAQRWARLLRDLVSAEGTIMLPRFRLEFEHSLNQALSELGMRVAFDPHGADFRPLTRKGVPAAISKVLHKTFIEVNEEGTEAAAATAVTMVLTASLSTPPRFTMIVDRPFLCTIRDTRSGLLLFVGAIRAPRSEQ